MIDYVLEHPIITELRQWILDTYCLTYRKHFKLYMETFDDGETDYGMGIEIGNFEVPIIISGNFQSDDEFLTYLKKEFAFKQLYRIPLFEAVKDQVDELDGPLFYDKQDKDGKWIKCQAELIDNRQIRQIQNEHLE